MWAKFCQDYSPKAEQKQELMKLDLLTLEAIKSHLGTFRISESKNLKSKESIESYI